MKKIKILTVLSALCLLLVFTLTACGGGSNPSGTYKNATYGSLTFVGDTFTMQVPVSLLMQDKSAGTVSLNGAFTMKDGTMTVNFDQKQLLTAIRGMLRAKNPSASNTVLTTQAQAFISHYLGDFTKTQTATYDRDKGVITWQGRAFTKS